MTISLILIKKIASLFLIILSGYLLVRLKLLRASDSNIISVLTLYLITPCMIITSFEVDFTPDVLSGLLLAVGAAALSEGMLILLTALLSRFFHFQPVEKDSIIFSNCGNLIIPLVVAMLGPEWVIYSSAYIAVQLLLLWSYGKAVLCGERKPDIRKVLTNVNMISIFIGVVFFITGIRLPSIAQDAADSLGSMIGPASMLVTGMLIADMDLMKYLKSPRLWLCVALRLLILPALVMLPLRFSGLSSLAANGETILLITLLATVAPSASNITQMAQVFGGDAGYASAINVVTILLCIITMPLFVTLYML